MFKGLSELELAGVFDLLLSGTAANADDVVLDAVLTFVFGYHRSDNKSESISYWLLN